jgi:hypothetical protein
MARSPYKEAKKARGGFMRYAISFWCPRACNVGMAVMGGKWGIKLD